MNEKNQTANIIPSSESDPNKLPDLAPPSNLNIPSTTRGLPLKDQSLENLNQTPTNPVLNPAATQTSTPNPTTPLERTADSQEQVFSAPPPPPPNVFNPNAPLPEEGSGINDKIGYADQPKQSLLPRLPISSVQLIVALSLILLLGIGGFAFNELVLNKITTLKLVSDQAQFYLSLAVKKDPQAQKAKGLINKFPAGDKFLKSLDQTVSSYIGDSKSPLIDIAEYAQKQIFLTRVSKDDTNKKQVNTGNRILSIIDTGSSAKAKEALDNFKDDKKTYAITPDTYKGTRFMEIQLQSEKELYDQSKAKSSRRYSYSLPSAKPRSTFAAQIGNFLVAGEKRSDVEKAVNLSQTKKIFGFGGSSDTKSIAESSDHQKIASYFPKDAFIKYFQRQPITGYNLSSYSPINIPSVDTYPYSSEEDANTYQKLTVGLDLVFRDDGAKLNSYQLDWFEPNKAANNTFSLSNSLASKLPKELSGVGPTIYFETRNLKAQYETQKKMLESLRDSKNRHQREAIKLMLESQDDLKQSYKKMYGIDYENDFLNYLTGQTAGIVNLGRAKKGPEILLVAEVSDSKKFETSLQKLTLPNLNSFYSYSDEATEKTFTSPTPTDYKGNKIYQLTIFEYNTIKYSIYFTVTDKKAVVAVSDSDQSLKEIIDAEKTLKEPLTKNAAWQKQFAAVKNPLINVSFIEPVKFLGVFDYLENVYPEYSSAASSLYGGSSAYSDDLITIYKAYLKTLRSVGSVSTKDKGVFIDTSFINVVELPKEDKRAAEDAMDRIYGNDNNNSYRSVLGVNTTTQNRALNLWDNFYQSKVKPLVKP